MTQFMLIIGEQPQNIDIIYRSIYTSTIDT
jgi:hypothetical protein